jgi:glycosyltransferase involved in cell wall biosynthesis
LSPLVSILIPCYNAEPWLAQTLESALAQTWPHREIIVVNDGSTDPSLQIARQYEVRGIRVLDQPNRGASAARNAAFAACQGEWIEFLDADDLLAPDKIERQMRLAEAVGADFMLCGSWSRFERSPADADFPPQPLCGDFTPTDWAVTKFEQNAMIHPAAWLTPRALTERAGPWDESLSLDDDGEFFTRVVLASRGVHYCREAVSYYRSGLADSLSGTKSEKACASAYRSVELSTARLLAAENTPRTRRACAAAYRRFCFEAYPRAPELRARAEDRLHGLGFMLGAPDWGPAFRAVARVAGWRFAKRVQQFSRRLGSKRLAALWHRH